MNWPEENGKTKRESLTAFRDMFVKKGKTEEEINRLVPELIEPVVNTGQYLAAIFFDLNSTRQYGAMGGAAPITYNEIKAYSELTGEVLDPIEVETIKLMDRAFVAEYSKLIKD